MTLKYEISALYESYDYDKQGTCPNPNKHHENCKCGDPDLNWFVLAEIDELDDQTIICESKYRNELQRLKNYLDKEQRQLTVSDDC